MSAMFSPSMRILPLVGRSIPAMRFNRVDLPEPEGPIKQTKPPASMSRLASCSATTCAASRLNIFDRFRISTATMARSLSRRHFVACLQLTQLVPNNNGFVAGETLGNVHIAADLFLYSYWLRLNFSIRQHHDSLSTFAVDHGTFRNDDE